jgi:hypothetical protein
MKNYFATQTSITSSVKVDEKVENDGQEKEWIGEALKHVDTMSPLKP